MENLRNLKDRDRFHDHDDEMNWKNFEYDEIFEDSHFLKIIDYCDW